jgi:hypothetical protein
MKKQTMAIVVALQVAAIACASGAMEVEGPDVAGGADGRSSHSSHHGIHHLPMIPPPPSPRAVLNSRVTNKGTADKLEQVRDRAAALKDTLTGIYTRYWHIARYLPIHQEERAILEHILTLPASGEVQQEAEEGFAERDAQREDAPVSITEEVLSLISKHGITAGQQASAIAFQEVVIGRNYEKERHGPGHGHWSGHGHGRPPAHEGDEVPDEGEPEALDLDGDPE